MNTNYKCPRCKTNNEPIKRFNNYNNKIFTCVDCKTEFEEYELRGRQSADYGNFLQDLLFKEAEDKKLEPEEVEKRMRLLLTDQFEYCRTYLVK